MIYYVLNKYSGSYSVKLEKEILLSSKKIMPDIESKVLYTVFHAEFNDYKKYLPDIDNNELKDNDVIVAVGGDGTVNICLNFILINNLNDTVKLAIIPMGTGNNMLKTLNLSKRVFKSIQIIKKGIIENLQYGLINDKYPFFNCSLGFTSFILKNRIFKSRNGYFIDILVNFFKFNSTKIKLAEKIENNKANIKSHEKQIFTGFFINTKYYASIIPFLNKNSKNGKISFYTIEKKSLLLMILFLFNLFSKQFKKLNVISASEFSLFIPKNIFLEIDGDIIPHSIEYKISYKGLVKVITN